MAETGRRAPPQTASNDVQNANDIQSTESRMRRALGLTGTSGSQVAQQRPEQARQRHRFVQDGGVPVVMLGQKHEPETAALRERITALETALDTERSNHAVTKRALSEQQTATQAVKTRLAHAELAHNEALESERRLRNAAQQASAEALAAAQVALPVRRAKLAEPVPVSPKGEARDQILVVRAKSANTAVIRTQAVEAPVAPLPADKPKRGRPRINPPPEPKPVRWWTPSFRAKTKA